MSAPPETIEVPEAGVVARRYEPGDADVVHDAITSSRDHLRPFMFWADQSREDTARFVREAIASWAAAQDYVMGIFDATDGSAVGGTGLHPRTGPEAMHIGYWVRADREGRGIITAVTRALTNVALALPGVERVEIHCDVANTRSAAVPRRLGFTLTDVVDAPVKSPGETGRHQIWATTTPPSAS